MSLKTKHLILRPWEEKDEPFLYETASIPGVGTSGGWQSSTIQKCGGVIPWSVLSAPESYALCLKQDGRVIGCISLMIGRWNQKRNLSGTEGEIGLWVDRSFWEEKQIAEALNELIRHAFADLALEKLWSGYFEGSDEMKQLLTACGFSYHHTQKDVYGGFEAARIEIEHITRLIKRDWQRRPAWREEIRKELMAHKDKEYRAFQKKLIPGIPPETIIGVRTPQLRDDAKKLAIRADIDVFLHDLPHRYFEENQLHAFLISEMKDADQCFEEVNRFLPYVDNWATCDQMSPKVFKKEKAKLLENIWTWIDSGHAYTCRFGIGMLMEHFLDDDFEDRYPRMVAAVSSDEYYVNMMIAWYFATALAKQYEAVLPFFTEQRLEPWTHNKAIQKAVESRRITPEQKEYLKSLKVKI